MNKLLIALALLPVVALAKDPHGAADIKRDVARHRQMAAAHGAAANCLAGGGKPEACQKKLQADCKGLGIGKYCGMRHEH